MSVKIITGNALDVLASMASESVHCCISSPPYWGLRSYQGDPGMIGLEPTFDEHLDNLVSVFREVRRVLRNDGTCWLNYGDAYAGGGRGVGASFQTTNNKGSNLPPFHPDGFKPKDLMMMPARVAMALRDDGAADVRAMRTIERIGYELADEYRAADEELPALVLRVLDRLAEEYAQAKGDSWWLRSEIIWHKPNPMPESVTDRPTSAHEKMFLLSKSAKYFYDNEAVRQEVKGTGGEFSPRSPERNDSANMGKRPPDSAGANLRNVWTIPTHSFSEAHFATFSPKLVEPCIKAGTSEKGCCSECGAPWVRSSKISYEEERRKTGKDLIDKSEGDEINTHRRWRGNHITKKVATTGWSPTCCDCHVVISTPRPDGTVRDDPTLHTGRKGLNRERNKNPTRSITRGEQRDYARQINESPHIEEIRELSGDAFDHYVRTDRSGARPMPPDLLSECIERGWLSAPETECSCKCKSAETKPCVVLDPFSGAGTVGLVAQRLQRDAVLIEISPEYAEMSRKRIHGDMTLFADVKVVEGVPTSQQSSDPSCPASKGS